MKRFLQTFTLLATLAVPGAAQLGVTVRSPARLQPIQGFLPKGPDLRHLFVTDSAHVISSAVARALHDSSAALRDRTGVDVSWITLPTLGGNTLDRAADILATSWRLKPAGPPGTPWPYLGVLVLYVPGNSSVIGANIEVRVSQRLAQTMVYRHARDVGTAMAAGLEAGQPDDAFLAGFHTVAALAGETAAGVAPPRVSAATQEAMVRRFHRTAIFGALGMFAMFLIVLALFAKRALRQAGVRVGAWEALRRFGGSLRGGSWSIGVSGSTSRSSEPSDTGPRFGGGGGFGGGGASGEL